MEFLSVVIAVVVLGIPLAIIFVVVFWYFGPESEQSKNQRLQNLRSKPAPGDIITDDDPNWEDHIRHDPYHPGGNH